MGGQHLLHDFMWLQVAFQSHRAGQAEAAIQGAADLCRHTNRQAVFIGDQHRFIPNQGIHHSARNGLAFGLISFGIVGLLNWLNIGLEIGLNIGLGSGLGNVLTLGLSTVLSNGLIPGLIAGLSVGLLAGLLNGGLACLRHSVVRLLLWRAGSIPWNYPRFLDDAAEHILLRKVGGSYIFVHRLLLEYFASLDTTPPLAEARAQKQYVLPIS